MRRDIYLFGLIAVASIKQWTTNIYHFRFMAVVLIKQWKTNKVSSNSRHFDDICPRLFLPKKETDRVAIMLFKLKSVFVSMVLENLPVILVTQSPHNCRFAVLIIRIIFTRIRSTAKSKLKDIVYKIYKYTVLFLCKRIKQKMYCCQKHTCLS